MPRWIATCKDLTKAAELVEDVPALPPTCRDPDDDHVLAAAQVSEAYCIITGDADLPSLREHQDVSADPDEAGTMPTRSGTVTLRGAGKTFAVGGTEVAALRGVALDVAPGEFVSLVGPSGCGKSILLRLVAGLERPDAGEVWVDGEAVLTPSLTRGIVFQDHRLFPWMSVEANVLLALHRSGLPPARCSRLWVCAASRLPARSSSRAAWRSAPRSPAASPPARACCSSTSRWALSMP